MSPLPERLSEFEFGFAGAEEEGAYRPELLVAGYHDPGRLIEEAVSGRRFLFVGYKGAGKSAIGQHIRLISDQHDNFVKLISLADFPFGAFAKVVRVDEAEGSKYPAAWSLLLLIQFLDSFLKDNGGCFEDASTVERVTDVLKELALLPHPEFKKVVLTTSKNTFAAKLKAVETSREQQAEPQAGSDLLFFIERLREPLLGFSSPNRHLIILDGLDDILTKKTVQFDALSALVFEANRLNHEFAVRGITAKIIVVCRTDLFERLPGPNTNKLRQDAAITLDWYRDTHDPKQSDLIALINRRASMTTGSEVDIFSTYFPPTIRKNAHGDQQPTAAFLLDLTRHTPRDFIMLLTRMKAFCGVGVMTRDQIMKAVAEYSREYFLPEIKNELCGYIDEGSVKYLLELIGALRKREFSLTDLSRHSDSIKPPDGFDLVESLKYLFECSAIGNVDRNYFTFRYRNRQSAFSPTKRIVLHFGMWKAFNVV
jgi:hypothetical protein